MNLDTLVGKKIQIEPIDKSIIPNNYKEKYFLSEILNAIDSKTVEIAAPMIKSSYLKLPDDSKLIILYRLNDDEMDVFESFEAIVTGREMKNNILYYTITALKKNTSTQRRKFFRIPCSIKTSTLNIDNKFESDAYIYDLSACGARLISDLEIPIESTFNLVINLKLRETLNETLNIKSKVVRIYSKNEKFEIGVDFIDLLPYEQDLIVKYVINEQRKQIYLKKY